MVRRRLIAELELITGGRVELGSFHTTPFRLRIDVRNLTIHGLEKPGDVPYAHVDRLVAQVKIISALGAEFGVDSLVLEHPVVHVVFFEDGSTNQPQPGVQRSSDKNAIEELFSLSIGELAVNNGELIWDQERIPLNFSATDVSTSLSYSVFRRHYTGHLKLGKVDTHYSDYRPFTWAAAAQFLLTPERVEFQSLQASSGRSHLEASGHIDDFRHPKIHANYGLSLDLVESAAIARRKEVRSGVIEANGQGDWSIEDFSSSGKLQLNNVSWRDQSLNLQKANGTAQFTVNSKKLTLSQIQARLLGGAISGDGEINNWLVPADLKAAKGKKSEELSGSLLLRLRSLSAAETTAAVASSFTPLSRINLAGDVNGSIESRWTRSWRNSETVLAVDVQPSGQTSTGQLPLTLHTRATYRAASGELELSPLDAKTQTTQIHASGLLSNSSVLHLTVNTTDLREWQSVLFAFGSSGRIPLTLHGQGSFTGTAMGRFPEVTVAGNLQAHDFDIHLPATAQIPERQLHCDSMVADVQLSQNGLTAHHGVLHHGGVVLNFDLTMGLHNGQFLESSPVQAKLDVHNADLNEIVALAGRNYPVSGTVAMSLLLAGTRTEWEGNGHAQLSDANIYGHMFEHVDAGLHLTGNSAEVSNAHISYGEARVTGEGGYNFQDHGFKINVSGKNFDLGHFTTLQATRVKVDGKADFMAQGSGTLEEPSISATFHLHDLAFDQERAGDFAIDAETKGADMHITGRSNFENAELNIDGNIHLRENWPSEINLHFNHLDVDSLLRTYLRGNVTGHSALAGDVHLQGPLRLPRELQVTADLSDLYADIQNVKVRNDGPVRFVASDELLKIEQFRLIGEGTDLSAEGSAQLTGEQKLNMRAQGRLNLKLIETLNPDFTSSGVVAVDVGFFGSVTKPAMQGRLQITNGSIAYFDLPSSLSEINGSLVFNQDRLQIENLTARTGGGAVKFAGFATTYNRQINFDLTASGQDVRLRYPPGVSSTATADLHWTGSNLSSTLSGDITVTKLAVTPGFDFAAYMERASQTTALPQTNPLLNRIRMDVHIVTTPELQMQTAIARLSGDADLHLRGSAAKPVLQGRADIIEGDIYFNGSKYRLERGEVTFTNPVTTTPNLDLQASTQVRDYDITVNLNGTPDKLKMNWRSEPPLPEADIIALLALGRTQEESAQLQQSGQSQFTQEASSALLAEALNATVSNRVQRLFGVSRIKIDPQGLSTETNPARGPQVTLEQQVANNLTLTYSTNVSQVAQQIIQVEYNLTRNISVIGIRDQNGVVSFDVRIRQRKK
jgi:translocation and assembly module TamB